MEFEYEDVGGKPTNWQHPSGKNGKHKGRGGRANWEASIAEIDAQIPILKNKHPPGWSDEVDRLNRLKKHWTLKLADRGESHSRKQKGPSRR